MNNNVLYRQEKDMYEDIISSISAKLKSLNFNYKVFRTWKEFNQDFKDEFPTETAILGKGTLPDITILYWDENNNKHRMIIEVKIGNLIVKDIGQAKMYGDIFNADKVLLVSLKDIRGSFIVFAENNHNFLLCANKTQVYTCVLKNRQLQLQSTYPRNGGFL